MAVKIRLKRMGAKKNPFYRVVVADSRSPRDGKIIELLGTYNPLVTPAEVKINEELALNWLNKGAIPTDTVKNLLSREGIIKKFHDSKVKTGSKPKAEKKVEKKEEKKPAKKAAEKPAKAPAKKATTKKAGK